MRRLLLLAATMACVFPATAGAVTYSSNATVVNRDFGTEQVIVTNGAKVTFQNDTWGAFNNDTANSYEGRLSVIGAGSTAYVDGGLFHGGGCSDGIQLLGDSPANYGTAIVSNSEFTGLTQGSCRAHVDPIQLYGGKLTLTDSYFHGNNTGIMSPDSAGILTAKNNVFIGAGYAWSMCLGGMQNADIQHNYVSSDWSIGLGCTNGGTSSNNTIRNNVSNVVGGGSNTVDHNVNTATRAGGTGRCGYATPSAGVATDGTVIGLNDCGSTPPPADDHQPTAAFTTLPSSPAVGQTVTFDVSGSTCQDAPCTYALTDEPGAWPIKSGPGPTLTFAFQGAGTKHVNLRVTDADGDVSPAVAHDVVVGATVPPPAACDQACVDAYKAQITDLTSKLADMTLSRDNVQTLADAYKARALAAEDKLAKIHTLSAP